MKDLKNRELLIISAYLQPLSDKQNERKHQTLVTVLKDLDIDYIESIGCYKGVKEKSIIVLPANKYEMELMQNITLDRFKQESVLHQNSYGSAALIYANGQKDYIGIYKEISETETANYDAYTKTLENIFVYS